LYSGLASAGTSNYANARFLLMRYVNTKAPDPFPGARAMAWREIARCAHELGQAQNEREALEVAVDLEPDHDGESWLRLAELQLATPHGGYRLPETRWAKGMSLLPRRAADLLVRWREIGEQELKSLGIDLDAKQSDLVSERTWIPSPEASPYELYRLARLQIDDGDISRAQNSIKRLLDIVPDFGPGLDLALEVALKVGKQRDVIAALLERMRVLGPDEHSNQVLAGIQLDLLTPKDMLALMRASPERFGRLQIARTYFAHGDVDRALSTLEGLPEDSLGDDGRILAADLQLRMQRPVLALEMLEPLGARVLDSAAGQAAWVSAALGAGAFELLGRRMVELSVSGVPDKERWLALCDRMLQSGAVLPAKALLRRLDSKKETRGGDVVLGLASAALAQGDARELSKLLARAQAFDDDGQVAYLKLLERVREGRLTEIKAAVAALRASRYKPSRLESTLLDLVSDQTGKARKVIEGVLETEPRNTHWQLASALWAALSDEPWTAPAFFGREATAQTELFVHGAPPRAPQDAAADTGTGAAGGEPEPAAERDEGEPHDPRRAACLLLALQNPLGRAWAQVELRGAAPASYGDLWPKYSRALLAQSIGDGLSARNLLEEVVTVAPDFGPAWDLLDDLAIQRNDDAQALSELRLRRTQAMGEQNVSIAMQWYDRARVLQWKGDIDGALEAARAGATAAPESARIMAKLGELCAVRGEYGPAIAAYRSASSATPPAHDPEITHAFLRVLDEAERTSPPAITPADHMSELDKLAALEPDDPFVPVAMARLDLKLEPNNPSFAVARAYARLERFRLRHKAQSLESLAPGSAEEWVDFHLALDPERAEALLQSELELEPGALAPWLLLGRVYTNAGKTREAIEQFALAFGLAPQKSVVREYMRALAASEMSIEGVVTIMNRVTAADGRKAPDEEAKRLAARALYNMGAKGIGRAAALLEPTDEPRENAPSSIERIGLLRALVWCARGETKDLERARATLAEILPLAADPYLRTMLIALSGLVLVPSPAGAP
jgi:tetratricopeptide (TPR) repeat protein